MAASKIKFSGINNSPIESPERTVFNNFKKTTVDNVKIRTWFARRFFAPRKLNNIVKKMLSLNVDFMEVRDTRWPGSGSCTTSNSTFYFSENGNRKYYMELVCFYTKIVKFRFKISHLTEP